MKFAEFQLPGLLTLKSVEIYMPFYPWLMNYNFHLAVSMRKLQDVLFMHLA